jgi:hypothetical protein
VIEERQGEINSWIPAPGSLSGASFAGMTEKKITLKYQMYLIGIYDLFGI